MIIFLNLIVLCFVLNTIFRIMIDDASFYDCLITSRFMLRNAISITSNAYFSIQIVSHFL